MTKSDYFITLKISILASLLVLFYTCKKLQINTCNSVTL